MWATNAIHCVNPHEHVTSRRNVRQACAETTLSANCISFSVIDRLKSKCCVMCSFTSFFQVFSYYRSIFQLNNNNYYNFYYHYDYYYWYYYYKWDRQNNIII